MFYQNIINLRDLLYEASSLVPSRVLDDIDEVVKELRSIPFRQIREAFARMHYLRLMNLTPVRFALNVIGRNR